MDMIMSLTVGQMAGGIAGIVIFLSAFIEIIPIKINPISGFLRWVGSKTNSGLKEDIEVITGSVSKLEAAVATIKAEADERNAINCRVRILQFGDELRLGARHSKENFDQVLLDIDDYELYCNEHPEFKNNKTVLTKEHILEEYTRCMDNNDFL